MNFFKYSKNLIFKTSFKSNVNLFHYFVDIIEKESDGFFSKSKKIIVIVDYPLTNMQK
jgi:hypothetical protein